MLFLNQLAQSLGDTLRGIDAWRQALATLPNEDPSPAELKQREQYHAALQAALDVKAKLESGGDKCIVMRGDAGKFPWDVAREMESELQEAKEAKMRSSVSRWTLESCPPQTHILCGIRHGLCWVHIRCASSGTCGGQKALSTHSGIFPRH
jgi:hypothetical protein